MATTSQTYAPSSMIPTNTLSSSDSPTPTGDEDGDLQSLIAQDSSPPLIVAFLAIGLFVFGMIGVFAYRRLMRRQRWTLQPVRIPRRESVALGKRPLFWDLWSTVPGSANINIEDIRWENITPLAAVITILIPREQPEGPSPPVKSVEPHQYHYLPFRVFQCLPSGIQRRFHLAALPASEPPPSTPPPVPTVSDEKEKEKDTESCSSDEIDWGETSSLQVSVIIVMPGQRTSSSRSERDGAVDRDELGEYCIGTVEVPWIEGE